MTFSLPDLTAPSFVAYIFEPNVLQTFTRRVKQQSHNNLSGPGAVRRILSSH